LAQFIREVPVRSEWVTVAVLDPGDHLANRRIAHLAGRPNSSSSGLPAEAWTSHYSQKLAE
jgi:hypothetical protein